MTRDTLEYELGARAFDELTAQNLTKQTRQGRIHILGVAAGHPRMVTAQVVKWTPKHEHYVQTRFDIATFTADQIAAIEYAKELVGHLVERPSNMTSLFDYVWEVESAYTDNSKLAGWVRARQLWPEDPSQGGGSSWALDCQDIIVCEEEFAVAMKKEV